MAGPLAAATASTVTNPMDVVRARVQVAVTDHLSVFIYFVVLVWTVAGIADAAILVSIMKACSIIYKIT